MTGGNLLCFVLVITNVCYRAALAAFAGPYWLRIRQFQNCPKQEVAMEKPRCDMHPSSVFRYNHTIKSPVIDLNMTLSNRVFDRGASTMTLDVSRWDTVSGWRTHFLVMSLGELCFIYEDVVADIVKYLAEIAGIPTKCPIADGTYRGVNCVVQLPPLRHFPSLPYGRYKVYILVGYFKSSNPKELRSCLKAIADVVPRT
ncbi:uncharacterized protein LOC113211654 isoform X2 [Frankliniella occidentalis]|uniref:Uncharacterized protein LOC113211654 isoform X2 n=1 Tax=Frankliniella occidentalis TaxID=133901 RepID=A0A6J1T5H9_FRAOC|nr:uncharacterized protein LOC113211654 isoform X2 [Frankliniella occidentalis]